MLNKLRKWLKRRQKHVVNITIVTHGDPKEISDKFAKELMNHMRGRGL